MVKKVLIASFLIILSMLLLYLGTVHRDGVGEDLAIKGKHEWTEVKIKCKGRECGFKLDIYWQIQADEGSSVFGDLNSVELHAKNQQVKDELPALLEMVAGIRKKRELAGPANLVELGLEFPKITITLLSKGTSTELLLGKPAFDKRSYYVLVREGAAESVFLAGDEQVVPIVNSVESLCRVE